MRNMSVLLLMVVMAVSATAAEDYGTSGCAPEAVAMVGNTELSGELEAPGLKTRVSGRMSLYLAASREDLAEGKVRVGGANLAFFSVPQGPISGVKEPLHTEGLLGFATSSTEATLRYDERKGVLVGEIGGFVDTSQLATVIVKREERDKVGANEFFETLTQPATLRLEVTLDGRPWTEGGDVGGLRARVSGEISVEGIEYGGWSYPAYTARFRDIVIDLDLVALRWWEVAKRICVQPVRIGRLRVLHSTWWGWPHWVLETTGAGLAFGQPGVTEEWSKADVVFSYREWKTVWDAGYWVTSDAGTEEEDLRAEVDDDDCIETFFVNDFDPVDAHGGGATWGGGTAGSKVITSDANARNGIDLTHLAHEYGHVIGLHHPSAAATANLYPASTGTLMCPSGFNNDNPTVNSQENKDHVANPLFQFAIKWRSGGPDCQNDADCGACP